MHAGIKLVRQACMNKKPDLNEAHVCKLTELTRHGGLRNGSLKTGGVSWGCRSAALPSRRSYCANGGLQIAGKAVHSSLHGCTRCLWMHLQLPHLHKKSSHLSEEETDMTRALPRMVDNFEQSWHIKAFIFQAVRLPRLDLTEWSPNKRS